MADPTTPSKSQSIEDWTASTAASMARLSLTPASAASANTTPSAAPPVRGTAVTLDIPLDASDHLPARPHPTTTTNDPSTPQPTLRRKSSNRDSLRRREALLMGKEGSRRRQKYENSYLLSNPHAVPPEPQDWQVRPTHTVKRIPYGVAGLWEERYAAKAWERERREREEREKRKNGMEKLPREVRARLKRAGRTGLLGDLEFVVREFVEEWERSDGKMEGSRARGDSFVDLGDASSDSEAVDSSDEEVVFVGRKSSAGHPPQRKQRTPSHEKLVLDSLEDDAGARFGRWLVHTIAEYYDLRAWSITTNTDPAHREQYVGMKQSVMKTGGPVSVELPRPLWGMV